jgi:hypothetical protein
MTKQQQRSWQAWAKWRKLVAEQAVSGETVKAFCRKRGLCAPHFFAWKKRLREAAATNGNRSNFSESTFNRKFVEVKLAGVEPRVRLLNAGRSVNPAAHPLVIQEAESSSLTGDGRVEVRVRRGRSLLVGPGFDAALVRALIEAVESAA